MSDKNEGLNDLLARKKRIKRMKTGLLWLLITWMLALMLISVTLIAKVHSLQEQIDIITENTIRSQQVDQQENHMPNTQKDYESVTGEAVIDSTSKVILSAKEADTAQEAKTGQGDQEGSVDLEKKAEDKEKAQEPRKVYLTFDDGPSKNTRKILKILDRYDVKATFFVTGRKDEASLKLYQEIAERGHTIGMHSYSHKYDEIYASVDTFEQDLEQIQSQIFDAVGITCRLYRFPGGSSNQVSKLDMKEFIRVLKERKITYFDWNVECGDASSHSYTAKEMVDNVMQDVVKYHTSVVLMHDAENKSNTVKALPVIIEKLLKMDARLLPIDENTSLVQHVSAESVED
ncbi:MAG: polysaccharide deacetylase [Eubacterium sp.]|nr:polysaccharide deacetylase [Eubacterium sp.]